MSEETKVTEQFLCPLCNQHGVYAVMHKATVLAAIQLKRIYFVNGWQCSQQRLHFVTDNEIAALETKQKVQQWVISQMRNRMNNSIATRFMRWISGKIESTPNKVKPRKRP